MALKVTPDMHPSVKARVRIEAQIARCLVEELIGQGFKISVNDGEETTLKNSFSVEAVLDAMFTTEEDRLIAHSLKDGTEGWFRFIYGNDGWDVLSDYSVNMEPFIVRTNALIDELG